MCTSHTDNEVWQRARERSDSETVLQLQAVYQRCNRGLFGLLPNYMARINLIHPIDSISGSMVKRERVYYRTRNGRTHAYKVVKPYKGPATAAQSAGR